MKIHFVIGTSYRPEHLQGFLQSLIVQTNKNWECLVVFDELTPFLLTDFSESYSRYDNIKFLCLNRMPHNDYGHAAINHGRYSPVCYQNFQYDPHEMLLCMNSDDNYLLPTYVDEFLEVFEDRRVLFAYCNMVHHKFENNYLDTKIRRGKIDLGCFVTRMSFARHISLGSDYESDFDFANEYTSRFCLSSYSIKKIKKILYVHN